MDVFYIKYCYLAETLSNKVTSTCYLKRQKFPDKQWQMNNTTRQFGTQPKVPSVFCEPWRRTVKTRTQQLPTNTSVPGSQDQTNTTTMRTDPSDASWSHVSSIFAAGDSVRDSSSRVNLTIFVFFVPHQPISDVWLLIRDHEKIFMTFWRPNEDF